MENENDPIFASMKEYSNRSPTWRTNEALRQQLRDLVQAQGAHTIDPVYQETPTASRDLLRQNAASCVFPQSRKMLLLH